MNPKGMWIIIQVMDIDLRLLLNVAFKSKFSNHAVAKQPNKRAKTNKLRGQPTTLHTSLKKVSIDFKSIYRYIVLKAIKGIHYYDDQKIYESCNF